MKWLTMLVLSSALFGNEPLRVGASFVTPPLEFIRRHKQVGFEIDIAKAIAASMDKEIAFIDAPYHQLTRLLKEGECDMILGGYVHGTQPMVEAESYYEASVAVLFDHKKRSDLKVVSDLKGAKVGVVAGTNLERVAAVYGEAVVYQPDRIIDALADLNFGRIDAFFHLDIMIAYLKYASPTIAVLGEVPDVKCPLVFGVREEVAGSVNHALAELTIDPICKRWFGAACLQGSDRK